jgi:4-aminobutyrate aminotransferase-like enzyme
MEKYKISYIPKEVPQIKTKFRQIKTRIPVPESISVFNDLEKYEARAMHGQLPVVWDKAEDFQVFDRYGNCWIDFTSTIFLANTGHSNSKIVSAIKEGLNRKLIHTYTFASEIRAKFLKKLIEMTPSYLEKAFLLSAGTEATECALKLMRMYGQTISFSKVGIISFLGSMHGRTMGAEMLKGDPKGSAWIGYKDPNIHHLPFPYPWSEKPSFQKDMEDLQKETGIDFNNICGFMIESYQGWGAIFYPKEYIKELFSFAKRHNILVTFDEIQGGFGRTGELFAYQHYEVEPDLVCLGKGLSGSLPLSGVIGRKEIMDLPEIGSMSSTHSANPLCCAAGLANLEQIETKKLVEESARKGEILHSCLNRIKEKFPDYISYILGKGLLAAIITIDPKTHQPDGSIAGRVCEKAMQKGLLLVHTGRESIKIGPPLTISDEALIEGIKVIGECFEEAINEIN